MRWVSWVLLLSSLGGCTSFSSIARDGRDIYVAGATSYLFFTNHWIRKCVEVDSATVVCTQLKMTDGGGARAGSRAAVDSRDHPNRSGKEEEAPERIEYGTAPPRVVDCASSPMCARMGACAKSEEGCAPASEEHCRKSEDCEKRGLCTFAAERQECLALSESDCSASEACTARGECEAVEGRCRKPVQRRRVFK